MEGVKNSGRKLDQLTAIGGRRKTEIHERNSLLREENST
jgi:hypothetical protein